MSVRKPVHTSRSVDLASGHRVRLDVVCGSDGQEDRIREPRADPVRGLEQLPQSLLGDESADRADHRRGAGDTQLGPEDVETLGRRLVRVESSKIDAVTEIARPAGRHDAAPAGPLEVLVALEQFEIAEAGGEGLESHHGGSTSEPVVRGGVEAVDGVDDYRDAGCAGDRTADHTRFRIVRVDDVEALSAEDPVEFRGHPRVGDRVPGTARVPECDMPDPLVFQCRDVLARRTDRRDLEPFVAEPTQLWQQDVPMGQVDRGDVGDPDHRFLHGPRRANR